jgi:hypothetical protein
MNLCSAGILLSFSEIILVLPFLGLGKLCLGISSNSFSKVESSVLTFSINLGSVRSSISIDFTRLIKKDLHLTTICKTPTNSVQKCILPSNSFIFLPTILGVQ